MKIICMGDSLTEGDYGLPGQSGIANVQPESYPYFLAKHTGWTVVNAGRCGYRATDYWNYLQSGAVSVQDADAIPRTTTPIGTSCAGAMRMPLRRRCFSARRPTQPATPLCPTAAMPIRRRPGPASCAGSRRKPAM